MALNNTDFIVVALIAEIKNQLIGQGVADSDLRVIRGNQPTKQKVGAVSGSKKYQVFVTPITRNKNVMQRVDDTENGIESTYTHNSLITYQIDCLTDFDHSDPDSIDAATLCEAISQLMQQFDAITRLKESGVFLVNCGAVRPSYTIMDSDTYESTPSFDLQINYNSSYVKQGIAITETTGAVNEV